MRIQFLVLGVVIGFGSSLHGDERLPDGPWLLPKTWVEIDKPIKPTKKEEQEFVKKQQHAYYDFIWRSFVALNWPNEKINVSDGQITKGVRGKPDPYATLKDLRTRTAVWENYKEPGEVFPGPDVWDKPVYSKWNTVRPLPPPPKSADASTLPARRMLDFETLTEYTSATMQPYFFAMETGPLYDQYRGLVRYEVAVNRSFFTYIRNFGYYNAQNQADAVRTYINEPHKRSSAEAFQRPPFGNESELTGYLKKLPDYDKVGLIDVKAAWRVMSPTDEECGYDKRYICRDLHFWNDELKKYESKKMGLVALHVLRWTPNGSKKGVGGGFVASTFEQIDNVTSNKTDKGIVPASFNDGSDPSLTEKEFGFSGEIPKEDSGTPVNIYRATAQTIPDAVDDINKVYWKKPEVRGSVLRFYQLIGTQNHHPGPITFANTEDLERNGPQGPKTGVYSNANNLVNSALESYTQKNFTCIRCHIQARPKVHDLKTKGIDSFAMRAFQDDHFKILTFLLQSAKFPKKK